MPKIDEPLITNGQRLAINLWDLDRVEPTIRGCLLLVAEEIGGRLRREAVRVDQDRQDEVGVPLVCDLLTAACICDTLRSHDRIAKEYPTRVYVFRRAWSKLPGSVPLTVVEGGKVKLNPQVFSVEEESLPAEPISPQVPSFLRSKHAKGS